MSLDKNQKNKAMFLIIIFGIISLFGDIIYESARSVYGPFTKTLEMDIVLVGIITGISEFLGYFIRLFTGYFADKTKAHWVFTIVGYGLLISVPLLSMTGSWQIVSLFIICERLGKAIRSPAKDTILSQATKKIGTGWGFGLHEAMDQIGAFIGPFIFTGILLLNTNSKTLLSQYQYGFKLLWIPFIIVMISVIIAYIKVPNPEVFESESNLENKKENLGKEFLLYILFTFITTLGFISFVILGYYFKDKKMISESQIPLFYSIAMIVDAMVALIIGKIYDKLKIKFKNEKGGILLLITIPILSLLIPLFVFTNNSILIITGVIIWGMVMGTHETIMKSSIADLTHFKKRGTGYGIFNTFYGFAMFFGSIIFGYLYKINLIIITISIVFIEVIAIVFYYILIKNIKITKI